MKILLVEPDFPIPNKSKHKANTVHRNFIPIGLLKLASYHRDQGDDIKLVRGKQEVEFNPNQIMVTSLFTYWSEYVWDTVSFYRERYPKANIEIGGIYASLLHNSRHFKEKMKEFNATVHVGTRDDIEKYKPAYDLIDVDYQVIHAMRGCFRRCKFCGTWKIEPKVVFKNSEEVVNEIMENGISKVIFYDNNFLANPNAKDILESISGLRIKGVPVICESQSGFDGRLMDLKTAKLLKKARFRYPRIAWDNGYEDWRSIKKQIDYLTRAGYPRKDIFVFMLYNFDIPFDEVEKKRKKCGRWGVQIIDCRYRPLTQLHDYYNPQAYRKGQTSDEYYIHKKAGWTDENIRKFRKNVRTQNIGIRYGKNGKYDHELASIWSPMKYLFNKAGIKEVPKLDGIEDNNKIIKKIRKMRKDDPNNKDILKLENFLIKHFPKLAK